MQCRPTEEWRLPMRRLGARTWIFDRVDSTNTLALALASEPGHDGLVLLAREQTAGRGQYGRTWQAPPESSVLLSVLLFPPPALRRPVILTAWAAVAVCELARRLTGRPAKIKWPNDILLAGKKVCGILIEQRVSAGRLATIAGIGLNVSQTAEWFRDAELPDATSLACSCAAPLDWSTVARELIQQLDEELDRLMEGDLATLEARWQWHLGLLGRTVSL